MDDAQLLRYSRHILLSELGPDAQERFAAARALVVGIGGLGNPAAHFLAAAGIGALTLCDADHVDLTNLQRQILYATADIGRAKVDAAAARLAAINRACVRARKPLVSGAALRFDGQIAVFDARDSASPCYHCLFGEGDELEETRCATMGVFAPLVGIVGAAQAGEALKLIAGVGETLAGRLLIVDALTMQWRDLRVPRDPACPVCCAR